MIRHTIASEDYLKTIYQHTEWQAELITPSALAAKLGVAPSSVTEMVKKLAAAGLVIHVPYGPLQLTDSGRLRAAGVLRRHRLVETWLVTEMGYGWHEVHDEAEVLEHTISDRLLERIDERLGQPTADPHGDPIPAPDGSVPVSAARPLAAAVVDEVSAIVRISDRDPRLLLRLADAGIRPGTMVRVLPSPAMASAIVSLDLPRAGAPAAPVIHLDAPSTAAIWISQP
jgi:DtxR family Mn-dependent transcriptional regulator